MRRAGRNSFLALGDKYRIYILFVVVFAFMSLFAPRFFNVFNFTSILNAIAMNATAAIGFTVVMICGQLDLSIGTRDHVLRRSSALGLQPLLGFPGAIAVAVVGGALVGLLNGLLVAKAKINSFIVTLGTMTILQGAIYQFSGGNSISVSNDQAFAISDFLGKKSPPPRHSAHPHQAGRSSSSWSSFLRARGRGGISISSAGNRATAWLAGINTDRYHHRSPSCSPGRRRRSAGVVSVARLDLGHAQPW